MACSCDSCSSPRIIKTRTAQFWRWLAESRGETADRVILAPARTADLLPADGHGADRAMMIGSSPSTSAATSIARTSEDLVAELPSG